MGGGQGGAGEGDTREGVTPGEGEPSGTTTTRGEVFAIVNPLGAPSALDGVAGKAIGSDTAGGLSCKMVSGETVAWLLGLA